MKRFRLAGLILTLLACGKGGDGERPPNIILITLESLRPDHMGCYGYSLDTTPNLDEFARSAIRFTDVQAVTSWTLASHASILTGLYPSEHQVREPRDRLGGAYETIAERLSAEDGKRGAGEGYQTAAFVSGPFLRSSYNLDQGFDLYDDSAAAPTQEEGHGEVTNPEMERKLARFFRQTSARPLFLFAYFWDIHYDFLPPPPFDTMFVTSDMERFDISRFEFNEAIHAEMDPARSRYLVSQYDGEIRCTDEMLGRLFDVMKAEGLWENALIVITADHGEEFFEHGSAGHKNNLFDQSVRVPLLVKLPGESPPAVSAELMSQTNLAELLNGGWKRLSTRPGDAVAGAEIASVPMSPTGDHVFELDLPLKALVDGKIVGGRVDRWKAIRRGHWKLVRPPRQGDLLLFDVRDDPGDLQNLAEAHPDVADSLARTLAVRLAEMEKSAIRFGAPERAVLDSSEMERLRSLGYID